MTARKTAIAEAAVAAPTRLERKRIRRVEEILTAAAELLGERGYDSVSLEDVAERLDVTKGLLYHYFASKDELVTAAIETLGRDWTTQLVDLIETLEGSPAQRLRGLLTAQARATVSEHPAASQLFNLEREWPEPQRGRIKELRRRHNELFRTILDDGIRTGEFAVTDPDVTMQCIHAGITQAPRWTRRMTATQLEQTLDTLIDTLMKLVEEKPATRGRRLAPAPQRPAARRR